MIRGAGGKGDGGGGTEQSDNLRSTQTADVLDLLSEGEVEGLVNGLKSIYLDGVPLQNGDGTFNFEGVQVALTSGTQGQASIAGTDGVQNEVPVAVAVVAATPVVRTISNAAIDTVRVTIAVAQLSELNTESGDLHGSTFEWSVELQSNGGGFVEVLRDTVEGKTMSRYTRAKTFQLPGAAPWDIRVKRLTADAVGSNTVNAFQWATYSEIQSLKLRYPNSAMARVRVAAQQFARIPVRGYDLMGLRVQVPSNYNPLTRVYTGVWDGTFVVRWTDNPAWIYHDMVVSNRYGLGRYIATTDAFKWELYTIARYCDGMVPDGFGGQEPRFRCGLVLSTREQAYKVLTDLASIFRGMAYWMNADVSVVQDAPSDPVALFTPGNVVGGKFTYSGASNSKRHSSVVVWFNQLSQQGKLVPEVVVDRALEARYGVRPLELSPLGVWSRGQAQRIGKWVLYTEQKENQTVTFRVGLDGALVAPGKTFQVADPNEAGERMGGRVHAATASQVTLDAPVVLAAGEAYTLTVMLQDPTDPARLVTQQRSVSTAAGTTSVLALAAPFAAAPAPQSVWLLQSSNVQATTWRCLALAEVKGTNEFEISALAHEPAKYDLIEQGIAFEKRSVSRIVLTPPAPAALVFTETTYLIGSLTRSRMTLSWAAPVAGLNYLVRWQLNTGTWTKHPVTSENCIELDGLARGLLRVELVARNALGNVSQPLAGSTTVLGKTTRPSNVAGLAAAVVEGGVRLSWVPAVDADYLSTTLKIGGAVLFDGAASSFVWLKPALGTYTLTATHFDTSLNESAAAASVVVVVDASTLVQWANVASKPANVAALTGAENLGSNLVNAGNWVIGADGDQTAGPFDWYENPTSSGGSNQITLRAGPDGAMKPVWTAISGSDAGTSAEGGIGGTSTVPISEFNAYRYSVWIYVTGPSDGYIYLGCNPVDNIPSGALNDNPCFHAFGRNLLTVNKWYLFTGHVFNSTYTGAQLNLSGVYDGTTGQKVLSGTDFKWHAAQTLANFRTFQYYTGGAGRYALFCNPRMDLLDGSEPSLAALMADAVLSQATAAKTAASNAAADAGTALAALSAIANDGVLDAGEKPDVVLRYSTLTAEQSGIDAQAAAYTATTERAAYDAAVTALTSYLGSLTTPTNWSDTTGSTTIVRTTFNAAFGSVYAARQTLLNEIARKAGLVATWSGVSGASKPADFASAGSVLNFDPTMTDSSVWTSNLATVSDGLTGSGVIAGAGGEHIAEARTFAYDTRRRYRVTAYIRKTAGVTSGTVYIGILNYDSAGAAQYIWGGYTAGAWAAPSLSTTFGTLYSVDIPANSQNVGTVRAAAHVILGYPNTGGGRVEFQNVKVEDITDAYNASVQAAAAQSAADGAATNAGIALGALNAIADDAVLDPSEKPDVLLRYSSITAEQGGIDDQADNYAVTTEKAAYDASVAALTTYLSGLTSPTAWNYVAGSTNVVRETFNAKFGAVYAARQALLNEISRKAGLVATWGGVYGLGKPVDNATADIQLLPNSASGHTIAGNSVTRASGGTFGTNDSVYGAERFSGGAFCSFVPAGVGSYFIAGLSTNPNRPSITDAVQYEFIMRGTSSIEARDSGTETHLGTWSGGVLSIAYDGTSVRFLQDGAVLRTVAASGLTLSFQAALVSTLGLSQIRFGPMTDVSGALAAASAAQSTASSAATNAGIALGALNAIADDAVLDPSEKPDVLLRYSSITAEQVGIDGQADNYAVTTEKADYDAAVAALTAYLGGLNSPTSWNYVAGSTNIVRATFNGKFGAVYSSRQALLDKVSANAKARLGALALLGSVGTSQMDPNAATDVFLGTLQPGPVSFSTAS